ncbi:hypothetical protein JCM8097_004275 [Rhodosporidiobolus ruineniae]
MADPAFRGFVENTLDALLVFEGCKRGFLPKITRRLQEFEKRALVVSGAVFVFDEEETGIKRWTDGLSWSPSRTLGNFLVYRELDKKGAAARKADDAAGAEEEEGEDRPKSARPRGSSRLMGPLTSKADPVDPTDANAVAGSSTDDRPGSSSARQRSLSETASTLQLDRARERALVGSLTSSYRFRADGLVKKTISLNGLHLIGYYRIDDVTSGRLRTPSSHPELAALQVSAGFLAPSLFRVPPIVEMGPDGQLVYKGEADAPLSPVTRCGSSQGFPTPGLSQSRPTSSSDPLAQFGVLPSTSSGWEYNHPQPGSPRRGATATFRSNNRFEPYSSSSRFSPNNSHSSNAAYPFPLIPPSQLPPRTAMASMEQPLDGGAFQARTPPGEQLSTSAPTDGWHGPHVGSSSLHQSLPYGRAGYGPQDPVPHSPSFYQPRQAMPYAPTSDASTSNAIFAYNPPPPSQPLSHPRYQPSGSGAGSPPLSYQPYQPLSSYSSGSGFSHHGTPHLGQPASGFSHQLSPRLDQGNSPFATPPSTGQAHAAYGLGAQLPTAPHGQQQPTSSHDSPAMHRLETGGGWGAIPPPRQGIVEPTTSLASQAVSLMADLPPHSPVDGSSSRRQFQHQLNVQQQQQQHLSSRAYDYAPPHQQQPGSYQPYSFAGSDGGITPTGPPPPLPPPHHQQASSLSSSYGFHPQHQQGQHASGLVGSLNSPEEVVPAAGHGLGVSAYGEIVPAAQAASSIGGGGGGGPPSSSSYGAHLLSSTGGLRQPPPPLPSVGLSSHNVYASPNSSSHPLPPHPHQQSQHGAGRYGSPVDSHLAGLLERDGQRGGGGGGGGGGGRQEYHPSSAYQQGPPVKRELDDGTGPLATFGGQPLSPPPPPHAFQPGPPPPPPHQQQQHQGGQQWWNGAGAGEVWGQQGGKKEFPQS